MRITGLDWARESLLSFWWQDSAWEHGNRFRSGPITKPSSVLHQYQCNLFCEMRYINTFEKVKLGEILGRSKLYGVACIMYILPTNNRFLFKFYHIWMIWTLDMTPRVWGNKGPKLDTDGKTNWFWVLEWTVNININWFHEFYITQRRGYEVTDVWGCS